jgi:hypothetical protein
MEKKEEKQTTKRLGAYIYIYIREIKFENKKKKQRIM